MLRTPHKARVLIGAVILTVLFVGCKSGGLSTAGMSKSLKTGPMQRWTVDAAKLLLEVAPRVGRFGGSIEFGIVVPPKQRVMVLDAVDLTIHTATITFDGEQKPVKVYQATKKQKVFLTLPRGLTNKRATVAIHYSGLIRKKSPGLFVQEFAGDKYLYADLEPQGARRVFPFFDVPSVKVPWSVSVVAPSDLVVLSNGPLQEKRYVQNSKGKTRYLFGQTIPLPSYLVTVAVGPFELVPVENTPIPMRIAALKGLAEQTKVAKQWIGPLFRRAQEFFGIDPGLQKLDIVAVPAFYGAMENSGMITMARTILLHKKRPDKRQLRLLQMVLLHEFVHQWLGNLVTPMDWRNLWLSEGLTTWVTTHLLGDREFSPKEKARKQHHRKRWMDLDLLPSAIALGKDWNRPVPGQAFSQLLYKKGESLAEFVATYYGLDAMKNIMQVYVKKFAYTSVNTQVWTDTIERTMESSNEDTQTSLESGVWRQNLDSYLSQPGFPILDINYSCDGDKATLYFSQQRASQQDVVQGDPVTQDVVQGDPVTKEWTTPVCIASVHCEQGDTCRQKTCFFVKGREGSKVLAGSCPQFIVPKAGAKGYYRYKTDMAHVQKLLRSSQTTLSEWEDAILNLVFLMESGKVALWDGLSLLDSVLGDVDSLSAPRKEAGFRLLKPFIEFVAGHIYPGNVPSRFSIWVRSVWGRWARQLGVASVSGESSDAAELRQALVPLVATLGKDPVLIDHAIVTLGTQQSNKKTTKGEEAKEQQTAIIIGAYFKENTDWDFLKRQMDTWEAADSLQDNLAYLHPNTASTILLHTKDIAKVSRLLWKYPRLQKVVLSSLKKIREEQPQRVQEMDAIARNLRSPCSEDVDTMWKKLRKVAIKNGGNPSKVETEFAEQCKKRVQRLSAEPASIE